MDPNQSDPNNPNNPTGADPNLTPPQQHPQSDINSLFSPPASPTTAPPPDLSTPVPNIPSTPLPDLNQPFQPSATIPDPMSTTPNPLPDYLASTNPNPAMPNPMAATSPTFAPTIDPQTGQTNPATPNPTDLNQSLPTSTPYGNPVNPLPSPTESINPGIPGGGFAWSPPPPVANPTPDPNQPLQPTPASFDAAVNPTNTQPPQPTLTVQDLYAPSTQTPPMPPTENTAMPSSEPAPTDLSQLVNNPETPSSVYTPPISQPETLVAPANGANTEVPNIPTEAGAHKGIPKWLIGVGIGLLLAVSGASAYFILGIGQSKEETPPANNSTQQPISAPPITTNTAPSQPTASVESAPAGAPNTPTVPGFGGVPTSSSPVANPSPAASQGTSAADIIRQRQGL